MLGLTQPAVLPAVFYSENQFNAVRINDLLDLLNVGYLSNATRTITTKEMGISRSHPIMKNTIRSKQKLC
jgi:hypothetical protein